MGELPLLQVRNLKVHFPVRGGSLWGNRKVVRAVDGVDLDLHAGETLGLVGESGCGKSTLGRAAIRLVHPTAGEILFRGKSITQLSEKRMSRLRPDMQIVFQDPYASLNPRLTAEKVIAEGLDIQGIGSRSQRSQKIKSLMNQVGLDAAMHNRLPHEFSGGQRQRLGIARALALSPDLIVADEAVSALDLSVQAKILRLLVDLKDDFGLTYLFISHDLSVVSALCDRVAVMYLGKIVEVGTASALFDQPLHPYTRALISAVPARRPWERKERIILSGDVPSPTDPPEGCRFHTRCPFAQPSRCSVEVPTVREVSPGRFVACHWVEEIEAGRISPGPAMCNVGPMSFRNEPSSKTGESAGT